MKIGFVLDDTLDTPDGVQQYILTLGKWLSSQGHDIHYLVGHTIRTDLQNVHSLSRNVRVKFNGNRMSMPLPGSTRKIRDLLAREKFDVLHVQVPYSPFMAGKVIRLAPPQTMIVGTFHIAPDSWIVTLMNYALGLYCQGNLAKFDQILSVSEAAQKFAKKTFRIDSHVVPNVVNIADFAMAEPFKDYADQNTLVFLGRLVPRKGCAIFLQSIKHLRNNHPDLTFVAVVCGRGPLEAELRAYVDNNKLQDYVHFKGFVSETEKARYLKSAKVAVFPSTGGESFGIVLLEAMAVEGPVVIGADNEGYRTVLHPYPDALFPVRNSELLADKIHVLLTQQSRRTAAVAWQKSYIKQFDTAVVGQKLLEIYTTSVSRSKKNMR